MDWREEGYPGVSPTTRRLLNYWFEEEHYFESGERFEFRDCQREAIETTIFLYEVSEYQSLYDIGRGLGISMSVDPSEDIWPRYCYKMATGSGKTFVMGLCLVWQFFNDKFDEDLDSASDFLMVCPNLIVLDRLIDGFESGGMYQEYPFFIPPEWKDEFRLQLIVQDDTDPHSDAATLYLTNRQQFHDYSDEEPENPVTDVMTDFGGPRPTGDGVLTDQGSILDTLSELEDLVVINDEAHRAHTDTVWHGALEELADNGILLSQFDFTATAWDQSRGQEVPLPHIVYDYPLSRAIGDGITKKPIIAHTENAPPPTGDDFLEGYRTEIHAAHETFQKRKDELAEVGEKPVLFALCEETDHADEVARYFEDELGYEDRVLTIHTYVRSGKYGDKGQVKADEIEKARKAAKNIDDNEYEVVVSVLMLEEGWDVQNVSVILPMRAFGSDILTEQTLGRGLRPMFPNDDEMTDELYVIEHPSFQDLWQEKIKNQNLPIEVRNASEAHEEKTLIRPDEAKKEFDMEIPHILGGIKSTQPDLSTLDAEDFPQHNLDYTEIEPPDPQIIERELMSGEVQEVRDADFGYATTLAEYYGHMAKAILSSVGGSKSQVPALIPLLKSYVEERLFSEQVDSPEEELVGKLNTWEVRDALLDAFQETLEDMTYEKTEYNLKGSYWLSETDPFHTKKDAYPGRKTIFNQLPHDKGLEREFMGFLDNQEEVDKYTKVFQRIPLRIPYFDSSMNRHYYIPDFVVEEGEQTYLIETKGEAFRGSENVEKKASAAHSWCQSVSRAEGEDWTYGIIGGDEIEKAQRRGWDWLTDTLGRNAH